MNKLSHWWPLTFVIGLFLAASFSLDQAGFHSGLLGIIGCVLMIISLGMWKWPELKRGDRGSKRLMIIMLVLLVIVVILNLLELFWN